MTTSSHERLRVAALVGVVLSPLVLAGAALVVGALTSSYDPMADTISRLGSAGQPHAAWIRVAFVLYGLLVLAGAVPLGDAAPGRERWLSGLVGVYASAGVVAGLAPKDPPDVPVTTGGEVHVWATIVGGAAILLAMVVVARRAPRPVDRRVATVVAVLVGIGVVVFRFTWGSSYYGLTERGFITLAMVWLASLAVRLLREGSDPRARRGWGRIGG